MTAGAISFVGIMNQNRFYVVPFFQRGYVWNTDNWQELLDDLLDGKKGHFFGSVILKPVSNPLEGSSNWSVIDGQQRLTTLSVLFKVCYDILVKTVPADDEAAKSYYDDWLKQLLFVNCKKGRRPKIQHSMVDAPAYEEVMLGATKSAKPSRTINDCYSYFFGKLQNDVESATTIFEELVGDSKLFVGITLDGEENEQAIFDTINSAGVRLSSADTIKNCLFQRMMEFAGDNADAREQVVEFYKEYWESVFAGDEDSVAYWGQELRQGRVNRVTLEVLLQSVATIKQIYNPYERTVDELPQCYKDYADSLTRTGLEEFIKSISTYAKLYRDFFLPFGNGTTYCFSDECKRVLHILRVCDISTFDPLILYMLSKHPPKEDGTLSSDLKIALHDIERYVFRHIIAGASCKNFNKECWKIFEGSKTLAEYLQEKTDGKEIDDAAVRNGLRHVKSNKIATCVLFWMELYKRSVDKHDVKDLKYDFTLEHIMPKAWEKNWGRKVLPVVSVETGENILNKEKAEEARNAAILEVGNMTLLNHALNASIRNMALVDKINGKGASQGVAKLADMYYTKEVIAYAKENHFVWNETSIRSRTDRLADEFLKIW